jgi:acylphosphatase
MLVARRFRVTGRVQGVGFRYFAQTAARMEGLSGWVQNQSDGSVEVVAEGDRESVLRFEAKLRRGPAGARVDEVHVDEDVPSGRSNGFVVTSAYGRDE